MMGEITFYRCVLCRGVVSKWDIREGKGCSKCAGRKVMPTNLSLWEKLVQMVKHPAVWDWGSDPELPRAEFPGDE